MCRRFQAVWRLGPKPDDGVARPLRWPWRHYLLACRASQHLYLLRAQDTIFLRSRGHDRGRTAALHRDGRSKSLRRQPWAKRRGLRLLSSARVPPPATAQAHPCPATLSPDRRRTRCVPGITASAVAADRLGLDPSPVQRDGKVRDGASTWHGG